MNQANYMRALSKEESDSYNRELVNWVKKALKEPERGTYLYNIISQLKHFWESCERVSS